MNITCAHSATSNCSLEKDNLSRRMCSFYACRSSSQFQKIREMTFGRPTTVASARQMKEIYDETDENWNGKKMIFWKLIWQLKCD